MVVDIGSTCDRGSAIMDGNQLTLVVRGFSVTDMYSNNTLWQTSVNVDSGAYSGWLWMPGSVASSPTLADWKSGNGYCLVIRGMDNRIYINKYIGFAWQGWTALQQDSTSGSAAAAVIGDKLHMVVVGMDGTTLWHSNLDLNSTSFSGWAPLAGSTPSPPTLTS